MWSDFHTGLSKRSDLPTHVCAGREYNQRKGAVKKRGIVCNRAKETAAGERRAQQN